MKRVRESQNFYLFSERGSNAVCEYEKAIALSATISDFVKDVPDATEFTVPDTCPDTINWIVAAIDLYPLSIPEPSNVINVICALNYLRADQLLNVAAKLLIKRNLWNTVDIPRDVMLNYVYPLIPTADLLQLYKTHAMIASYILRLAKKEFAELTEVSDETLISAYDELKNPHIVFDPKRRLFLSRAEVLKAGTLKRDIIVAAIQKHGSYVVICKLREEREESIRVRLEHEMALLSHHGFRGVTYSEPCRQGKSQKRWANSVTTAINVHKKEIDQCLLKRDFTKLFKLVTLEKFKQIVASF